MKRMITIAVITLLSAGCTQPDHAKQILESQGYTNVQMQGYDWLNCSKDDTYHDKFTAKGPTGKQISGVVCGGLLFRGATVRLD